MWLGSAPYSNNNFTKLLLLLKLEIVRGLEPLLLVLLIFSGSCRSAAFTIDLLLVTVALMMSISNSASSSTFTLATFRNGEKIRSILDFEMQREERKGSLCGCVMLAGRRISEAKQRIASRVTLDGKENEETLKCNEGKGRKTLSANAMRCRTKTNRSQVLYPCQSGEDLRASNTSTWRKMKRVFSYGYVWTGWEFFIMYQNCGLVTWIAAWYHFEAWHK